MNYKTAAALHFTLSLFLLLLVYARIVQDGFVWQAGVSLSLSVGNLIWAVDTIKKKRSTFLE